VDNFEAGQSMPGIEVAERIPAGHKLALRVIPQGEPIRKYNQIIGFASQSIPAGTHVHSHNTEMRPFERDYAFGVDKKEDDSVATPAPLQAICVRMAGWAPVTTSPCCLR